MTRIIPRILSVTVLVVLLGTFLSIPVLAAGLISNNDVYSISKDQVINDDLYIAAKSIIIDGTINGDIFCVAQNVIISGTVNGGVTVAGGTVTITGTITNGARIAAQTINISGKIGRDLFVAGSDFSLTPTANVKRDLLFGSQSANIAGNVDGNIKGGSNTATFSGKIGGNVEMWVTQLTLANTAAIQGKVTYTSNKQAIVQSGAQINGTVTRLPQPSRSPGIGGNILGFFMIAVTGIIAVLLLGSARLAQMADSIRNKPWLSLGWGALVLVVTPIAAIIIMITVIGIPLGFIALALYLIALYLSQIPAGLFIGRLILRGYSRKQAKIRTIVALVLGLFLLLIAGIIPVLNVLAGLLVVLFGLGSLSIWLWSLKHRQASQTMAG
jgi:cytoskeletal protein CcmA (bactofilin family)